MSRAVDVRFDPARATVALARMRRAPNGPVAIAGAEWGQGAMGALLSAEFLAAQAGVVPWFRGLDGTRGVLIVGEAREHIDRAPEDVRTLYLATHAAVRQTHARAEWASAETRPLDAPAALEAIEWGIIALTAVAIAAVVGTAWYFARRDSIEVDGRNLRTTATAAEASRVALAQLAATGKIDPGVWEVFRTIAEQEREKSWLPYALGAAGVVVLGAGGAYAWHRYRLAAEERAR